MRLKSLAGLRKQEPEKIVIAELPTQISMHNYVKEKAYKVNELVKKIHKSSCEWYGYLLAEKENPEIAVDVGIGINAQNQSAYTRIEPEEIARYDESLVSKVINGWVHSHGNLGYMQFSGTDDKNQITVVDYVATLLKKPIAKKEILADNLELLVEGKYQQDDLKKGTISIITDAPVTRAKIMQTIYGGFSYGIVIGDEGWHEQAIYYIITDSLGAKPEFKKIEPAKIAIVDSQRKLTSEDIDKLAAEVKEKIKPPRRIYYPGYDWLLGKESYGNSQYDSKGYSGPTGGYGNQGSPGNYTRKADYSSQHQAGSKALHESKNQAGSARNTSAMPDIASGSGHLAEKPRYAGSHTQNTATFSSGSLSEKQLYAGNPASAQEKLTDKITEELTDKLPAKTPQPSQQGKQQDTGSLIRQTANAGYCPKKTYEK